MTDSTDDGDPTKITGTSIHAKNITGSISQSSVSVVNDDNTKRIYIDGDNQKISYETKNDGSTDFEEKASISYGNSALLISPKIELASTSSNSTDDVDNVSSTSGNRAYLDGNGLRLYENSDLKVNINQSGITANSYHVDSFTTNRIGQTYEYFTFNTATSSTNGYIGVEGNLGNTHDYIAFNDDATNPTISVHGNLGKQHAYIKFNNNDATDHTIEVEGNLGKQHAYITFNNSTTTDPAIEVEGSLGKQQAYIKFNDDDATNPIIEIHGNLKLYGNLIYATNT